jgi:uncharacterized damage-inducible protein DinB
VTDGALRHLVRHSLWANVELLAFCDRLSPEQLAAEVPGTYGGVHATLQHIVNGDRLFISDLIGESPIGGDYVRRGPTGPVLIEDLIRVERDLAALAERVLVDPDDERVIELGAAADRQQDRAEGKTATAAIVLAGLVHHGEHHRSQVATALSAQGLESPVLDVYAYGRTIGAVT